MVIKEIGGYHKVETAKTDDSSIAMLENLVESADFSKPRK